MMLPIITENGGLWADASQLRRGVYVIVLVGRHGAASMGNRAREDRVLFGPAFSARRIPRYAPARPIKCFRFVHSLIVGAPCTDAAGVNSRGLMRAVLCQRAIGVRIPRQKWCRPRISAPCDH